MIVGEVLSDTALPRMLDDEVLGAPTAWRSRSRIGGIVVGALAAGPLVSLLGLHGAFAAAGLFDFRRGGAVAAAAATASARLSPPPD